MTHGGIKKIDTAEARGVMVSARIAKETCDVVDAMAERSGIKRSGMIRYVLEKWVEEQGE